MVVISMPAAGAIAAGNLLTVNATVTLQAGERYIDHVDLYVPGQAGKLRMSLTAAINVYSGDLDVSAFPTGSLTVAVTATDLDGKRGSAELTVTRDAGPLIQIYQPKMGFYRGSAPILFTVLNPTTSQSFDVDPTTVRASVGLATITTPQDPNQPVWTGTIDFNTLGLSGDQVLLVSAKNMNGTVAQATAPFTVDETGPTITFMNPVAGQIVGGVMQIQIKVDDPAGVDQNSVWAVFGGNPNPKDQVQLQQAGGGMMSSDIYEGQFDTTLLPSNYVSPNFSVRAADSLGNNSEQAIQLNLDNVSPALDLDPPEDFHSYISVMHQQICSAPTGS
jgi:hypothetical protein